MAANKLENDKILAINSNFFYFDSKLRLFDLSECKAIKATTALS